MNMHFGYQFKTEELATLKSRLLNAKNILILPHSRADGDALGSARGLQLVLKKLGINSEIICPDAPKVVFPCEYKIAEYSLQPDLLISVDCASKERCFYPDDFKSTFFINIDHHISNTLYADMNIVLKAPSACEVLTSLLCLLFGEAIFDKEIAEALLFGVLSDTLIYSTSEVAAQSFLITSFLLSSGADYQKVKKNVLAYLPVTQFQIWAKVISEAKQKLNGQILILKVDKKLISQLNLKQNYFAGFINNVSSNVDTNIIIFISEFEENTVDISMRSKITNVSEIAEHFSGGGHKHAAGFKTTNISLEDLEEQLLKKLTSAL